MAACSSPKERCAAAGGTLLEEICYPSLPAEACRGGLFQQLGEAGCAAAGPVRCAAGFERAGDGVSCEPVLPSAACALLDFPLLGSSECVPFDDCARPFPPVDTTITVDGGLPSSALDATHYQSLVEAVRAAPAKAVIALYAGAYDGAIAPTGSLRIEGQCANRTVIGDRNARSSVQVGAGAHVILSHLSIASRAGGISVLGPAYLNLESVHLNGVGPMGVEASGAGATVVAHRLAIRQTLSSSDGGGGIPLVAADGAQVSLEEGWLEGWQQGAAVAMGSGSRLNLERVVIAHGTAGNAYGAFAVFAAQGGRVDLSRCAIDLTGISGPHLEGEGSFLLMQDSVIADHSAAAEGLAAGRALYLDDGAEAQVFNSSLMGRGRGVVMAYGRNPAADLPAKLAIQDSVVTGLVHTNSTAVDNTGVAVAAGAEAGLLRTILTNFSGAGVHAEGALTQVSLSQVQVQAVAQVQSRGWGAGLYVTAGASVHARGLTIEQAGGIGVTGLGADTRLLLEQLAVLNTKTPETDLNGMAVSAYTGASMVVEGALLLGSDGVALVCDDAGLGITRARIEQNGVGVHVNQGSTIEERDALPELLPGGVLIVGPEVRFEGNATRVGAETVPLPKAPPPFAQ